MNRLQPSVGRAQLRCILLPLYVQMSDRERLEVVDALREAVLRR